MAATLVELIGVNGELFTLAGPGEGDQGVWLATDVKGLYDPPVKVVYEEPGNWPGARYLSHRILRRDIVFGVWILNGKNDAWLRTDSAWRKAWAFDRDCILRVTTDESGTRELKIRLGDAVDVSLNTDPRTNATNKAVMTCISGDPFWYEEDVIYPFVTQKDTTFDPSILPFPWPQNAIPSETIILTVDPSDGRGGLNPTDEILFPRWTLPASIFEPSQPFIPGLDWLGAPTSKATIWTIPDMSFTDESQFARRITLPSLIGGLVTSEVQVVSTTGSPTGGFFTLVYDEFGTTPNIAQNASAGTFQSSMELLVGAGNVTVSGGPTLTSPHGSWKISFGGALAGQQISLPQVFPSLTGGQTPWATVQTSIQGGTATAENALVDSDPRVEQVSSESGSALWARMNGVRFQNFVPPYTRNATFQITASGCVPGQMGTLRLPRAWTRPWGLE